MARPMPYDRLDMLGIVIGYAWDCHWAIPSPAPLSQKDTDI